MGTFMLILVFLHFSKFRAIGLWLGACTRRTDGRTDGRMGKSARPIVRPSRMVA